ncbi:MAG: hypothetical protein GQ574_03025 [Crocinitomix sp.]|nr:hypothetical protein [Crocinitomix sp.]
MKIRFNVVILTSVIVCLSCDSETEFESYELKRGSDGIYYEYYSTSSDNDNRYTDNNSVYQTGNHYSFDYCHIDQDGDSAHYHKEPMSKDWKFVPITDTNYQTVKRIVVEVQKGLSYFKDIENYDQTVIRFYYVNNKNKWIDAGESGLIENEQNIWMHPPRTSYLEILELAPFPYIQAPYEVGNTWAWSLDIGKQWGDERWATWPGLLRNEYFYEISNYDLYETDFGSLYCYEITAIAKNEIGSTKLVSLFNFTHGFLNLEFTNINGTMTILTLRNN